MSVFDPDLIPKEIPPDPPDPWDGMVNEISTEINKEIIKRLKRQGLLP
jgi:hypothetical protein